MSETTQFNPEQGDNLHAEWRSFLSNLSEGDEVAVEYTDTHEDKSITAEVTTLLEQNKDRDQDTAAEQLPQTQQKAWTCAQVVIGDDVWVRPSTNGRHSSNGNMIVSDSGGLMGHTNTARSLEKIEKV